MCVNQTRCVYMSSCSQIRTHEEGGREHLEIIVVLAGMVVLSPGGSTARLEMV